MRVLAQSLGSTQPDPSVNLLHRMAGKKGGLTRGGDFGGGFASPFAGIRAFLPATGAYPVVFVDVVSVRGGELTDLNFE